MKTIESSDLGLKIFKINDIEIVEGSNRANKIVVNLFNKLKNKKFGNQTLIRAIKKFIFLISNIKKFFKYLKQVFIKALILKHFDLKSYIQIETNILGYAMNRLFN